MFYLGRFILVWLFWLFFADKKRWRELFAVSLFAVFLGFFADAINHHYELWDFKGIQPFLDDVEDEFEIYTVVAYLFIQWLPNNKKNRNMILYWFVWTGVCAGIEWIHVITGHMVYFKWWNLGWSYVADWLIFWLLYQFHRVFHLRSLNQDFSCLISALGNHDDVIFLLDKKGDVVQTFGYWFKKHNVSPECLIGKNVMEIVGEKQSEIARRISENVLTGHHEMYEWRFFMDNPDTYCDFQTTVSPVKNTKGEIIGVVGVSREIHCGVLPNHYRIKPLITIKE